MDETAGFKRDLFNLLSGSFARVVGRPLVASGRNSSWLYDDAPFAVLAHNTEPDPRFIYANRTAQRLFEYDWEEFTNVPSRLSAPPVERAERSGLLDEVSRNGFIDDYSGIRVAKSGRLFRIEQAVVWQLLDQHGRVRGQGATFGSWREVDA